MSGPARPSAGNSATQELAMMRLLLTESQEAQNVILRQLELDMRDVRDRLTHIEAKEIIPRLVSIEARLVAIEAARSQTMGAAKLVRGIWIAITGLASMGFGAIMLKLFGEPGT